jgi:hypothetical protein
MTKPPYRWLQQIEKAFGSAIETSNRYKGIMKQEQLQVLDTETELETATQSFRSFHLSLRKINETRIKPRKRDRTNWALYKKTTFEELVSTLSILVNNPVQLFPTKRKTLEELCRAEVAEIESDSLPILSTVSEYVDILLPTLNAKVQQWGYKYDGVKAHANNTGTLGITMPMEKKSGIIRT